MLVVTLSVWIVDCAGVQSWAITPNVYAVPGSLSEISTM